MAEPGLHRSVFRARLQVKGESFSRPGGAVLAYLALAKHAAFTSIFVGDLDGERAIACERRLSAIGATAKAFPGSAARTVSEMVAAVPPGSLCMAYVDPTVLSTCRSPCFAR